MHLAPLSPEDCLGSLAVRLDALAVSKIGESPLHRAPGAEIALLYVVSGRGRLESEQGSIAIAAGTIIVVPCHTATTIASAACPMRIGTHLEREAELVVVWVTLKATINGGIDIFEQLEQPLAETPCAAKCLQSIFRIVTEELAQPGFGTRMVIEAMVKQSLVLFLRTHLDRVGVASPVFLPLLDPKLRDCIRAILDRPHAPHSVSSLARVAGMSGSRFATHFAATYGKTPMKFVQAIRLRNAANLLRTSDLPLKAIASRVGYASRSHLSRVFQMQFGTDPTSYRAGNRPELAIFQAA
jgi:AraC-like DNA-binding protein